MALMRIGKFAKEIGVTTVTLRKMHKTGELVPCHVTDHGTRYYSEEQLARYMGSGGPADDRKVVGYCRVSTRQQKDDLERQVGHVRSYMAARGYQFSIIEDIGSGINYKKPGLMDLMQQINDHKVSKVVVLYKDRLMRFGFEMFEQFCALNDVGIEIIDSTEDRTKEQELADDLVQIVTVFANRLYGQRSKQSVQLIHDVKSQIGWHDGKADPVRGDTDIPSR